MEKDEIKKYILPVQLIFESLCSWPSTTTVYIRAFAWFINFNLVLLSIVHAEYILTTVSDISEAVNSVITINVVLQVGIKVVLNLKVHSLFQGAVRLFIMLIKKDVINRILARVWKNFWPFNAILQSKIKTELQKHAMAFVCLLSATCVCACICNAEITGRPYLQDHELILKAVFPFDPNKTYTYELLYVWQYFLQWYALFMTLGYDIFFIALVTICTVQFVILQEVSERILREESKKQRRIIFGDEGLTMTDKELLSECLKQHKMLLQ